MVKYFLVTFFSVFFLFQVGSGQCLQVQLQGPSCTGSDQKLIATITPAPMSISWFRGNQEVGRSSTGWDTTGIAVAGAQGGGMGASQLVTPTYTWVTASGNFIVSDRGNHRIQEWETDAGFGTTIAGGFGSGSSVNQLNLPGKFFATSNGTLFVADTENNRIIRFVRGSLVGFSVFGGTRGNGLDQLNAPEGITLDGAGNMYIADKGNHRILFVRAGETSGEVFAGTSGTAGSTMTTLNSPVSVFIRSNWLYVTDALNHRILRYPIIGGKAELVAGGSRGTAPNQLNEPNDCFVDEQGNILVADMNNHRIQYFSNNNPNATTVAGSATGIMGSSLQRLQNPSSVFLDANRNLYVTDRQNFRVLRFDYKSLDLTFEPKEPGTYRVVATAFSLCTAASNNFTVSQGPTITISGNRSICAGGEATLIASGVAGGIYRWSPAATLDVATGATVRARPLSTTTYTVRSSDVNGCEGVATFTLTVLSSGAGTNVVLRGPQCLNDSLLTVSVRPRPRQITWIRNGLVEKEETSVWNPQGFIAAGGNGMGVALNQLNLPTGVAVDAAGNLFVADRDNFRVMRWAPDGLTASVEAGATGAGTGTSQVGRPTKVFLDDRGFMYVVESQNHRIQRFAIGTNAPGEVIAGVSGVPGSGATQLRNPEGVYVDSRGNMYVADAGNNRIQYYPVGSLVGQTIIGDTVSGFTERRLFSPRAVTIDAAGNIYVADGLNHRIQRFPPIGSPGSNIGTTVAGGFGAGANANQLNEPNDVVVDAFGNLFIADMNNHRIQMWQPEATAGITVAGRSDGRSGFELDQLQNPSGVALDINNNLFVADRQNLRVMRFSSTVLDTMYRPTRAGDYTVNVAVSQNCGTLSNVVRIGETPNIVVTGNTNVCLNNSTILRLSGGRDYVWTPQTNVVKLSDSTFRITPIVSQSYSIQSAATNGCVGRTRISVTVGQPLQVTLTGPNCINAGDLVINSSPAPVALNWFRNDTIVRSEVASFSATPITVAGGQGPGSLATQFQDPHGIFVMPDGTFLTTDASNYRVMRFPANSVSGTPGEFWIGDGDGNGPRQIRFPTAIFVDTARRVFVLDQLNNRIQRFAWGSREGVTVAAGGGKGNGLNQLDSAMGIYVTQNGMIYVSDTKNHRVLRYGPNSVVGTVVAGGNGPGLGASQLNEPLGIWVDELSGDLYIADSRNHRIMRYREGLRSGERIAGTGFAGSDLGSLRTPTDVIIHPNGDVFICDGGNHRVLRLRANSSNIAVVAGSPNGGSGSTGNLLNRPFKIYIDQAGRLWVTELGNIRISRYGLSPISSPNNYRPVLPGTHYAVLTSATGCSITTDTIRILTGTQPAPPVARDTTACFNGPSPVINVMGNNLRWYPTATSNQGSATQPIVPTNLVTTQSLWLTQRSVSGCESNRVRVNVRVAGLPNARLVVQGKTALVPGDTTVLKAQSDSSVTQFRWFYNNNPILFSGRDLKINFSNTGNYVVDLISPEGCIRRSPTVTITRAEPEDRSLYLFPNPARDQVNLYFSARQNNVVFVKIISSFGRVMRNERTNVNSGLNVLRVNIADLQPGSYTMQVMNNFGDLLGSRQLIKMR